MVETGKPNVLDFVTLFRASGFKVVHEWRESHGDGGCYSMQDAIAGQLIEISYDREGRFRRLDTKRAADHDFLLAKEIKADPKRYVPVQKGEVISPCATAGFRDYQEKALFADDKVFYRISGVAGHGEYAFRITEAEAGKTTYNY
jgi:hypothetical protein